MASMATVIAALIAACASLISALIARNNEQRAQQIRQEQEEYQQRRIKQEREREYIDEATATSMIAMLNAMDVSLLALSGGHLNGNVEEARTKIATAKKEYEQTRSKAISRLL